MARAKDTFSLAKKDLFLKDLTRELCFLMYNDHIDHIYHNFTTIISTTINKYSTKVSYKMNSRTSNPSYDNDCKSVRKVIRDAPNKIVKCVQSSHKKEEKVLYKQEARLSS